MMFGLFLTREKKNLYRLLLLETFQVMTKSKFLKKFNEKKKKIDVFFTHMYQFMNNDVTFQLKLIKKKKNVMIH